MQVDIGRLRAELYSLKYEQNLNHTDVNRLSDRLPWSPKELGAAMERLRDNGEVSAVSYSVRTTWRIEL